MRIAQVAPLCESIPPHRSGGMERLISYLTESLVAAGHDVTLFATGDSRTRANLYASIPQAICNARQRHEPVLCHQLQLEEVLSLADRFDLIHFHQTTLHFSLCRRLQVPQLTTLHGRLDLPDLWRVFDEYKEMAVVSLTDSQRTPIPDARWMGTVYAGLPGSTLTCQTLQGNYFVFLGRLRRGRGVDRAIQVALETRIPLKIAGRIDEADQRYFEEEIKPRLAHPLVEYVGEVNDAEKNTLLGGARALLALGESTESSGLVLIESMACGTPVIALGGGPVEELMRDGVSGRIVDSLPDAFWAARSIHEMDRWKCREYFESRFTDVRMAQDYVAIYRTLL